MKLTSYLLLALCSAALFSACDDEAPSTYDEKVVVDGFMWIGQRMEIRLTHTVPVTEPYYADSVKVTGADVRVTVDGSTYSLTEANSGVPGIYAASEDAPLVTTGERYDLVVVASGDTLTAASYGAGAIDITEAALVDEGNSVVDLNPDTLEYGGNELRLTWTQDPTNFGYMIFMESLETSKYGESCDMGDDNGPGTYFTNWAVRYANAQNMPWIGLCYTGRMQFRVFSCDTVWWNYASSIIVGDLRNDPLTNIENGLGVFCAIDCDTFQVMVTDTLED
ncbi:MAG: DUF4249 family protein [bacterium]|nr:DUF4249 family protein [bacterium]